MFVWEKKRGVRAKRRKERSRVFVNVTGWRVPILQGHWHTGPRDLWTWEAPGQGKVIGNTCETAEVEMCPCVCHKSTTGPSFPHLKNRINLPHCLSFCPLHCLTAQIFIFKHLHFSPLAHFGRHPQLFIKSVLLKVINPNFQVRLSPCPSQPSLQLTFQSPFGNPFLSPVPHFLVLFADSFFSASLLCYLPK